MPIESPSCALSTSAIVLFFLWLVRRWRAAYASCSFARIIPLPSTTYVGQIMHQRLEFAVEMTPPGCLFDHSTIFDRRFIFPAAGSLLVVTLRLMWALRREPTRTRRMQEMSTINNTCGWSIINNTCCGVVLGGDLGGNGESGRYLR
jgi:hypothetical protein